MSSRVSFENKEKIMENDDNLNENLSKKSVATPIDIPSPGRRRDSEGQSANKRKTRRRRDSEASSSLSSLSETFSSESASPTTPPPTNSITQEEGMSPEVATSPILSYFMAHASPIKSASSRQFTFKDKPKAISPSATSPLDDVDGLPHVLHHARRMSQSWDQTKTIGISQKTPLTESQQERGASFMRRLSLSGSTQRPPNQIPNRTMESKSILLPVPTEKPMTAPPRRSATISQAGPIRRPPSPMGERMLKGDFHGF